jgi:hypothetical protein
VDHTGGKVDVLPIGAPSTRRAVGPRTSPYPQRPVRAGQGTAKCRRPGRIGEPVAARTDPWQPKLGCRVHRYLAAIEREAVDSAHRQQRALDRAAGKPSTEELSDELLEVDSLDRGDFRFPNSGSTRIRSDAS